MRTCKISVTFFLGAALSAQVARNQDVSLKNWAAPLYWQPSQTEAEIRNPGPQATTPAGSLVFVAMTPCRVVDTRTSQNFPSPFGPPSMSPGPARSFPLQSSTQCTIPSVAQAYSVIVTLVPPGPVGYLIVWPTGQSQPNIVTLDDLPGQIVNTGAVIPAGTPNGSISAVVSATTDLVIDINGYYAPSTGITLAQGTVSAPSLSFAGDAGTGMFSSGTGILNFAAGGSPAMSIGGPSFNTAVGIAALGSNTTGNLNTAIGYQALTGNTTGRENTAVGFTALSSNTSGIFNTALGDQALQANSVGANNATVGGLFANTTGSFNTATGANSMPYNTTGWFNTAVGAGTFWCNTTGYYNTAIGAGALCGSFTFEQTFLPINNNIAVGYYAGLNINGDNNIDIGNQGNANDRGIIRVGTSGTQTSFFAAGIAGSMVSGSTVLVDATTGQLGTASSSRRYKEDIQDMTDASRDLLKLRPVTFRYQKPYADGTKPLDYGLIAEEVAEVYPGLVVKNKDGQVETVQYHKLIPMLLNELQRLQARVEALEKGSDR